MNVQSIVGFLPQNVADLECVTCRRKVQIERSEHFDTDRQSFEGVDVFVCFGVLFTSLLKLIKGKSSFTFWLI